MPSIPKNLGDIKTLKARYKKAMTDNSLWESTLRDCYDYCLPNRNLFNYDQPGQKKMDHIYDSTAIDSIQVGASKLQENIAPIWRDWAKLEPSGEVKRLQGFKEAENEITKNLEEITEITFEYIHNSNFSTQFYEAVLDLMIGTGTLRCDEDLDDPNQPINFTAIPQMLVGFEEGPKGTIETHWRRVKMKARNIKREYVGFEASQAVNKIIDKSPNEEVELIEGLVFDPKDKVYHGIVWVDGEERLSWHEDYQDSSPFITSRYTKVSGEKRGRGPALWALPDIKTLNKIKEFSLQKAAIDLAGIYTGVDDGQTNPYNMTISPGVVIPVASNNNQNPTLARLDTNQRLDLVLFEVESLQNNIRRAFFNDLRDPDSPVRSATEIAIEARELAKRVGSAFGRLQTELLVPILNRVMWILKRRGIIQPVKIDGREVAVKFTSPLAQAQDAEDLLAVQQAVEFTLNTAGPEALKMAYKTEDFGTFAAKKVGMSQELVRSPAEKAKVIEAGAAMAKQEMEQGGMGRAQPTQ